MEEKQFEIIHLKSPIFKDDIILLEEIGAFREPVKSTIGDNIEQTECVEEQIAEQNETEDGSEQNEPIELSLLLYADQVDVDCDGEVVMDEEIYDGWSDSDDEVLL